MAYGFDMQGPPSDPKELKPEAMLKRLKEMEKDLKALVPVERLPMRQLQAKLLSTWQPDASELLKPIEAGAMSPANKPRIYGEYIAWSGSPSNFPAFTARGGPCLMAFCATGFHAGGGAFYEANFNHIPPGGANTFITNVQVFHNVAASHMATPTRFFLFTPAKGVHTFNWTVNIGTSDGNDRASLMIVELPLFGLGG